MMTYPLFALGVMAVAFLVDFALRTRVVREASTWKAMVPLAVMTALADTVLTRLPIVRYDDALTSGLRLGTIPVEDFAYVVAAVIIAKSVMRHYEHRP